MPLSFRESAQLADFCTTIHQFLRCLRRFVGRTPWSAADAHVGLLRVAAKPDEGVRPTRLQPHNLNRPITARQLNQPSTAADPPAHLTASVLVIDVYAVEFRRYRRMRCVRAYLRAGPARQMQHDG